MRIFDDETMVERRARDADRAEARIDALASQAARRFVAIEEAVRRVRAVAELNVSGTLPRRQVNELLEEIVRALEEANRIRAADTEESI